MSVLKNNDSPKFHFPPPTHDSDLAELDRYKNPNITYCGRCGFTWKMVSRHTTWYQQRPARKGIFVLCKVCWSLLGSPEARIEYYGDTIAAWKTYSGFNDPDVEQDIKRAVANEG